MSQAPQSPKPGQEGPSASTPQLVVAAAFAFLVPVIAVSALAFYASTVKDAAASKEALSVQATANRIMPVGTVAIKLASANAGPRTGEEVFKNQCTTCHGTGMLGAPKFGDASAWGPRLSQGFETLLSHALKGFKAMPAQGGGDFSDDEVARGLVYMANAGGAKFPEPAAPADAASAASAP